MPIGVENPKKKYETHEKNDASEWQKYVKH